MREMTHAGRGSPHLCRALQQEVGNSVDQVRIREEIQEAHRALNFQGSKLRALRTKPLESSVLTWKGNFSVIGFSWLICGKKPNQTKPPNKQSQELIQRRTNFPNLHGGTKAWLKFEFPTLALCYISFPCPSSSLFPFLLHPLPSGAGQDRNLPTLLSSPTAGSLSAELIITLALIYALQYSCPISRTFIPVGFQPVISDDFSIYPDNFEG